MKIKAYVTDKYEGLKLQPMDLTTDVSNTHLDYQKEVIMQTWLGFGGAFTESACYALSKLDEKLRKQALKEYFGQNGIGYTLGRIALASCDFSLDTYDYLENGKLDYARDDKYIMPVIYDALKQQEISFLVSPWSPPAFMKSNGIRNYGGKLKEECYNEFTDYYINYLKHLKEKGLKVDYLSIQNEPAATQTWDSCLYTPLEEYKLATILNKKLKEHNLNTKILVWDHNRDIMVERLVPIYEADQDNIIYGAGIHWYDNEPFENIKKVHDLYPSKHLFHTEGCIEGGPHYDFYEGLERYARNIIGDMNNFTEAFIDWNLFLDEFGGPNWVGNFCDAPIMIKDGYTKQYSFYGIAHFSKFIKPGMRRIFTNLDQKDLMVTAFKDEKSIIIVILNQTEKDYKLQIKNLLPQFIKKRSITTFVLEEEDA